MKRENPPVASLISECLGAGTGCQWCVPILKKLHAQHAAGQKPGLDVSAENYASGRAVYRKTGERDETDGGENENGPGGEPSPLEGS